MATVELRVDVGGKDLIPHTFIVVTGPDGEAREYGFAPADPRSMQGPGKVYETSKHEYTSSTGKIPLTPEQYDRLMDYINRSIENPPPYDLWFGSQCANWAFNALVEAGIPAVASPNLYPDNFLRDLFETIAWDRLLGAIIEGDRHCEA